MIDTQLLEDMRTAAHAAALDAVDDARLAEAVADDVVAGLIRRGIAGLGDPIAHAAASARNEVEARTGASAITGEAA